MTALVTAQNTFGLALLQRVASQDVGTNNFLSPFSVATALQLVLDGAAGDTHAAIARTLHVQGLPADQLAADLAAQTQALSAVAEYEPVLTLANAVWADKTFSLAPAYVAQLQRQHQAEAQTLDFQSPAAVSVVNKWADKYTQGKIKHIVGRLVPPLLLANAVYFKARWQTEFSPKATTPGAFTLADGRTQQVPLMHLRSTHLGYQQGPGWQAVQLPYRGSKKRLSMQLFVPDQPGGLPALLAALTPESWAAWQATFTARQAAPEVDLTMPRFQLEWGRDLVADLTELGLAPALHAGADFTPMGFPAEARGFIGSILHKTFLAVDEQGTEAAAVTAVVMLGGGMPPPPPQRVTVRVDRPFFCAIVDDLTGAMLFGGAIYKPLEQ